ncbi:MAG TPA: protein kinase [Gammaproteobacteria bacterium]|nr:protein kinase [Gammaproteobacteria bacterium]HPQ88059.1 protein kinase [Gammaproteobacteria bacterium]
MLKTINDINFKIPGLRLISKIGEGGMSVVYLAEQISLKREVAVKVMRLEVADNDLDVQRFKHEAKIIAHLDHPNIINIYNIGQTSTGEVFFTMPYLNHGDLSTYLIEDEKQFIELLKSVCDGLSFAHDHGVVHRDIKPENLLFDKFGSIRIADFGIAISQDGGRMTKEHQIVGSAQYMSPEQARSFKVDLRTDIYSLGIVIYERLTGKVPFDGDESISILVNHVSTPPDPLPPKMRHWQKVIDKCLAKNPEDRFQSMVELKIALDRVPINSIQRTNDTIKNFWKDLKIRKSRWFIPGVSALVLLLLVLIFVLSRNTTPNPEEQKSLETNFKTIQQKPIEQKPVESTLSDTKTDNIPSTNIDTSQIDSTAKDALQNNKAIEENLASSIDENTAPQQNEENITPIAKSEAKQEELFSSVEDKTADKDSLSQTDFDNTDISSQLSVDEIKQQIALQVQDEQSEDINDSQSSRDSGQAINIEALLESARRNIESYQLTKPADDNAMDQLLTILSVEQSHQAALEELHEIGNRYFLLINGALLRNEFNNAVTHLKSFNAFNEKTEYINSGYDVEKQSLISTAKKLDLSSDEISTEQINDLMEFFSIIDSDNSYSKTLQKVLLFKNQPQVGDKLLDSKRIETILVKDNMAMTTKEITVQQYKEFVEATSREESKCRHKGGTLGSFFSNYSWKSPAFEQTPNDPVVCVSYEDALAYSQWLAEQTGNRYRLPTEQEWSFVAMNKQNKFSPCQSANLAGSEAADVRNKEKNYDCSDSFVYTAPVATFSKNSQGVYDMQGNVSEWTRCKEDSCQSPVAMGSSWYNGEQSNGPTFSDKLKDETGYTYVGIRLVRDL